MKNKYLSYFVIAIASIVIAAGAYAILHQGDVVAEVNGKPIYSSNIEEKIKHLKEANMIDDSAQVLDFKSMDKTMKENLIRSFIISDLIEVEAKNSKIDEDPAFKIMLGKFFIEKKANQNITEQKIKESYEKYVKEQGHKEEFKIKQILVQTEDEINKINQDLIKNNIKFEEVAKKHGPANEKDELGYFSLDQHMPQELENTIKNLQLNQVSQPFKTILGWHIIKLIDKRKATIPSFDEQKYDLREKLYQEYVKSFFDELLEKNKVKITLE